jgi:hypothetical protein
MEREGIEKEEEMGKKRQKGNRNSITKDGSNMPILAGSYLACKSNWWH